MPKISWLRYRNSRQVIGTIKNVTVSQKCGKWFVSIQTEFETETPQPKGGEVGLDMGIARFATLSDGQFFELIHAFKTLKGKLAKLHRRKIPAVVVQRVDIRQKITAKHKHTLSAWHAAIKIMPML